MNATTQPGPLEVRLSDQLGPLPSTEYSLFYEAPGDDDSEGWQEVVDAPGYTAKQMRDYAAQAVAVERERCAKVCDSISDEYQRREGMKYPELKTDAQEGAADCAVAIRRANDSEDNTSPMQPHSHGLL